MPTLKFKSDKAEQVRLGRIRAAIRKKRKGTVQGRPIKIGDLLQLSMSRKKGQPDEALRVERCKSVERIDLTSDITAIMKGRYLMLPEIVTLAKSLGHRSAQELFDYIALKHKLPFVGVLIKW